LLRHDVRVQLEQGARHESAFPASIS
jgi:hypothetical protein